MRLLLLRLIISALILCAIDEAAGEFTAAAGRSLHVDDGNFSQPVHTEREAFRDQQRVPGSPFNLKVQVSDVLSQQFLNQAVVEVYINFTRVNTALTADNGSVLLHVPYHAGLPFALVASKDGYICTVLPCEVDRTPIFSSFTMSLLPLRQGSLWLFEDSVQITGKTSDIWSQPAVQFPKSLLNLTDNSNVTMIKAYLTVPQLSSVGFGAVRTLGILGSESASSQYFKGFVSVELSPVAAVSVRLFSGDTELHVSGPIQISLSVSDSCGLQVSNVVPAWFFNQTTGGWIRKGLGKVVSVDGKLMWKFTAPHLGYWIAAPLSSSRGFFEIALPTDFILQHASVLMLLLGGVMVVIILLLGGMLYLRRRSGSVPMAKMTLPVLRKDQTTSTSDDQVLEVETNSASQPQDGQRESYTETHKDRNISMQNCKTGTVESTKLDPNIESCSYKTTQQIRIPTSLTENLFFYNQPVAVIHTPAFFHLDETRHLDEEQSEWGKSATLPRAGASSSTTSELQSKDSFTQTLPKGPPSTQNLGGETEAQLGVLESSEEASCTNPSRAHFSLPESVSVPGTLNKIKDSRRSVHLEGFSKVPSPLPPRAWFVSLEGKPAAEIHHAVSEQQRRPRPVESRETSLDSGVDMSEMKQSSGRRARTLERNATFVKSTSSCKNAAPQ